jgi:cobalt/nickel transport system ATP-binding protein
VLIKLKKELDISVVFATHNLDMALRLADRICLIDKGAIIKEGNPEDILMDESIHDLDLEVPNILNVYNYLSKLFPNLRTKSIPRKVEDLNKLIGDLLKKKEILS